MQTFRAVSAPAALTAAIQAFGQHPHGLAALLYSAPIFAVWREAGAVEWQASSRAPRDRALARLLAVEAFAGADAVLSDVDNAALVDAAAADAVARLRAALGEGE